MTSETKSYIGDGVYASFDGYQIWLTTENGIEATNRIAIEPNVWQMLKIYVKRLEEQTGDFK